MRGRGLLLVLVLLIVAGVQVVRPVPRLGVRLRFPSYVQAPGGPVAWPWPAAGQAAVGAQGLGVIAAAEGQSPAPIASLAKMMVAYIILKDHPLAPGASGPTVTVTPRDVAIYQRQLAQGQSVLRVAAGEQLTERQLLEGLLLPSGNNVADLLAHWDLGSRQAFVARMNAEAQRLGLAGTHYADVSGVNPGTVSTAVDQLRLAETAMAIPTFRHIVRLAQVTLPVAGTVYNVNYFLGRSGIIGVKTGSTTQAGGCYVAAAYQQVGGRRVLLFSAVLGQGGPQPLLTALGAGERLIVAVRGALGVETLLNTGEVVGSVRAPWGAAAAVVTAKGLSVLGWPGMRARAQVRLRPLGHTLARGEPVGTLILTAGSRQWRVPLISAGTIAAPSLLWRLSRV